LENPWQHGHPSLNEAHGFAEELAGFGFHGALTSYRTLCLL
jgi:hypothetical protein